jgi:hypothetical protein
VSAHGEVNRGAAFTFSLPDAGFIT